MQPDPQPQPLDLIWGAGPIGKLLGMSEGRCKYLLSKGELPGRKVGGKWVVSRKKLEEHFERERA
jgi:hypothetical protein